MTGLAVLTKSFLHHEEVSLEDLDSHMLTTQLYHSTPETQTDEAYNHPEGELSEWVWELS
jgi:hypothetical protein